MNNRLRYYCIGILCTLCAVFSPSYAQNTVDVHSHIILPEYRDVLKAHHAEMEESFPLPQWSVEKHLNFMDSTGIGCAILTMPAPQPYYGNSDECCAIIRRVNEASAKLKAEYPGRFKFCASVPLPDVDAATKEAIYALDTLKADGIKLATNSRGQYLGDVDLEPLMKVLDEHKAVIIIHPHKPVPVNDSIIHTTPLAMYEYPAETTRAVINMISNNVLVRYPNIKVVVPHCASFLPIAIPRMKAIHPAMLKAGLMKEIDWEANLSRLYYDLAGTPTVDFIKTMLTITTLDHIMYGSDYPYQPDIVLKANLNRFKSSLEKNSELNSAVNKFLYENAEALFSK